MTLGSPGSALSWGSHIPLLGPRALAQHGHLFMVGDEIALIIHASGLTGLLALWHLLLLLLLVCLEP